VPDTSTPASPAFAHLQAQYENALSCIRCGLCLSVCPTYQISFAEEESPRGRIALARALAEGALPVTPDLVEHSENCLLCEACTAICPAGVKMEPLGVAVREVIAEHRKKGLRSRLQRRAMNFSLGSMGRFRALCRMGWLYHRSGARALVRGSGILRLLRLTGAEAMLPEMPRRFLKPKGQRWLPPDGSAPTRRVALFTGCIMSTAFAETTEATARVLARRGCEVVAVPGQGCCGALHLHSGETEGAQRLAATNLAAFNPDEFDAIIVNSAGCGSTLKGYGHLIENDDYAEAFSRKVLDITEQLASLPQPAPADFRLPTSDFRLRVTLQEPCHLAHAQRITQQPRALLRSLPGVELREMNESALCCGSAGIYNLTHREKADTLLNRKLDNAAATGAHVIATANPGCLLQLQAGVRERGLNMQVRHIADIIDEAEGKGITTEARRHGDGQGGTR
jgi:glycolate oxidase iron-sulfur subunit